MSGLGSVSDIGRTLSNAEGPVARLARFAACTFAFVVAMEVLFDPPLGLYLFGFANGALYGLIAVGIILIYRTNRIINFAAAALGALPAISCLLLQLRRGVPYGVALPLALISGAAVGALVDVVIIRRFAKAPRLILTMATLGVGQLLAFASFRLAIAIRGDGEQSSVVETPWKNLLVIKDSRGAPLLNGDYVFAVVAVVVFSLSLAAFFKYTRLGIALRASAENADRALLLGIPVRLVGTLSWALAGLFGALAIYLRAPLVGIPLDGTLGPQVLLFTLAAAVIAKMDDIPVALAAGIAVGILEQGSVAATGSNDLSGAIMLVLILGALLLQRKSVARALDTGVSTWQSVKEFRPIPTELRKVREVVVGKVVLAVIVLVVAIGAPYTVSAGKVGILTLIPLTAIVAVSLVILTGWAGQVSLGQFALVGAGAGVAGGLAANNDADFFVALFGGILAGVVMALVIGLPALRVQGLYLAVTTLALGASMQGYFLKKGWAAEHLLPNGEAPRIDRPILFDRIDLATDRSFYFLSLVFLGLALLVARAFRRNRSGRVIIAVRDNQRAAPAYAINLARNRLAAFAVSGGIAGMAGALFAYQQGAIDEGAYGVGPSIEVFLITVIGGLTSLPGAVFGAVFIQGVKYFGEPQFEGLSLLVTGPGLLVVLLVLPGGFSEAFYRLRDNLLRRVATRRGIHVPSLLADRRIEPDAAENSIVTSAESHVQQVEHFDVLAPRTVVCPVCDAELAPDDAPDHEHLRPRAVVG